MSRITVEEYNRITTRPLKGYEVVDKNGNILCKRDDKGHLIKTKDWSSYDEDGRKSHKTRKDIC